MKYTIKRTNDYGEFCGSFVFDPETWDEIGSIGTGGVGHFSQQGYRTVFASPRKAKDGQHRFVMFGSGYWPCKTGGWSWGEDAIEVSHDEALRIMDPNYLGVYSDAPEVLA